MYELKYRNEDEMKDSGVEWLGRVPREWEVSKFKRYIKVNSGKEILDQDKIYHKKINVYGSGGVFKKTNKILHEGESVLFGRKGTVGKPIYVNEKFWTVDTMYYSISKGNILIKILYYLLLIYDWNKIITQTALPSVVASDLENSFTAVSNIEEQQKIINFLDIKSSQFDSIIFQKEKLIEKLEEAKKSLISEVVTGKVKIVDGKMIERKEEEMKDSGVKWLGMIPKDWEVKKLKYLVELRDIKSSYDNQSKYIGLENIESKSGRYIKSKEETFIEGICNYFYKNDVLFGKLRPYLAKCIVTDFDGYCSSELLVMKSLYFTPKLLIYILLDSKFIDLINSSTYGAKMPRASWKFIGNIEIPAYNKQTEAEILYFISNNITKLNNIITKTKSQIQKLKEAKQSLISEAVTGKIDLRDWEIKN